MHTIFPTFWGKKAKASTKVPLYEPPINSSLNKLSENCEKTEAHCILTTGEICPQVGPLFEFFKLKRPTVKVGSELYLHLVGGYILLHVHVVGILVELWVDLPAVDLHHLRGAVHCRGW